jgi:hypothetical protein
MPITQKAEEDPMRKALRVGAMVAAFALTAWIGVVALAQTGPTQAPTTSTTVGGGDQFKGNCDEAEHVKDPACVGATLVPEDNEANDDADDQGQNENADDQGDNNDDQGENNDDQGENEGNDNNGVDLSDDQGDNNDDQGENEGNDDQGENDDHQGDNDNQGEDDNSGPSDNSGSGGDQGEDD